MFSLEALVLHHCSSSPLFADEHLMNIFKSELYSYFLQTIGRELTFDV